MRRMILVLTMSAVMVAMMAALGTLASAQSPCPPTGPSGGPATLVVPDEALGAGFICLDEEAVEFFCPPEYELQLFSNPELDAPYLAECVEPSVSDEDGSGGVEPTTQEGEQEAESGEIDQYAEG